MITKSFIGILFAGAILSLSSCLPEPETHRQPGDYIIQGPQDLFPAFSPDGERIAYFHDAWDTPETPGYPSGLYIIDKDGTDRQLVLLASYVNSPSWSPDGRWLVFSNGGKIQKCRINGTSLTTLTELNDLEYPEFYYPNWSKNGDYILFDKPLGSDWGIYSTNSEFDDTSDGFGIQVLGRNPELSPSGNYIVYQTGKGGGGASVEISEIFLVNLTTQTITQLTTNGRDNRSPAWSPDGRRIAWSSNVVLFTMSADGTEPIELGYGNDPSWSTSDEVVYSYANVDFTKEVLYVVDKNGNGRTQISF